MGPAVILHELSHVLVCWLTLSKVNEVKVFEREGGSVSHDKPRVPLGQVLISLAPFFGGWILMMELARHTGIPWGKQTMSGGWSQWWPSQWASLESLAGGVHQGWTSALWVYGAVSCALIMIPSSKDMQNARLPMFLLMGLFIMTDVGLWISKGITLIPSLMAYLSPHLLSMLAVQLVVLAILGPLVYARKSMS
ncbi:MAG: M50 family metallopeptidase [Planctomycetota bacterium]